MPKSEQQDRTARVPLTYPIEVAGVEVQSLVMRRPTAGAYRRIFRKGKDLGQEEQGLLLLQELCELSEEEFDQLDDVDLMALNAQLEAFKKATP